VARLIVAPAAQDVVPKGLPTIAPDVPRQRRRERGASRYGRLNNFIGFSLVALVLISAVPVASNRPSWWLLWTMLLGILGIFYVLRAQFLMGQKRSFQSSQFKIFFAVAFLVPFYALIQSLPLADFLPSALLHLSIRVPTVLAPHSISVMPDASFLGALRAIGFILFLILTIEIGTQADRSHSLGFLLMIGILAQGLFGMISLKLLDDFSLWGVKDSYIGVLTGTFVNRNSIATFLGFGLILGVSYALERSRMAGFAPKDRGYAVLLTPLRIEILSFWLVVILIGLCDHLNAIADGGLCDGNGGIYDFLYVSFRQQGSFAQDIL
jgi:hypothetical protein